MIQGSAYHRPGSPGSPRALKWTLIIGLLLLGGALVNQQYYSHPLSTRSTLMPTQPTLPARPTAAAAVLTTAAPNHTLPARLVIPRIQVDAHVLFMGLTKSSSMAVPSNVTDVGWYKYGPLPGNKGSAVIAGHIDGLQGQPGVFANLGKLRPGDSITITDTSGLPTTFIVRTSKKYRTRDQPSEVFHSNDGVHLNLITCSGGWDGNTHEFLERLVVFADKG